MNKSLNIGRLLFTQPAEFWDRVTAIADSRLDRLRTSHRYDAQSMDATVAELVRRLSGTADIMADSRLHVLESALQQRSAQLEPSAPYPFSGCGDNVLGRLCFLAVRLSQPQVVLETGVLYGMTSAYILEALSQNGSGILHSVDLPPAREGSEQMLGCLVPLPLRSRWTLHRGASRRVLPKLLPALGRVGLFVHDSLHTYRNMQWEFDAVTPRFTGDAIVISDDVQANRAFAESFGQWPWSTAIDVGEKQLGVAIRRLPGRAADEG